MHNIGRLREINFLQAFKVGFHMPTKFVRLLRKSINELKHVSNKFVRLLRKSINELKHVLNKFGDLFRKHEYFMFKARLEYVTLLSKWDELI